ncbi:altered inheritance rate of mitochondria protein 25 [Silene latifolia]|uniref:altered inheritance rate of mitochondria protein 25 n=1 Tax=Silene latifolia TaxID=37657 RepID=UPI003D78B0BA
MRGINNIRRFNHIVKSSSMAARNLLFGLIQLHGDDNGTMPGACRRFKHSVPDEPKLDRDFFAKLWGLDKEMAKELEKKKGLIDKYKDYRDESPHLFEQPPVTESITGYLAPTSPEESQIAPLLARSNLLITRDIEWMNLMLGFEQENRYAIVDVCYPHSPVGLIREESNVFLRQFLRLRRPFTAYVTDPYGNEIFRIRRPFWLITSSIYAEVNGKEIGVVHQRWHLWRRIYDLYLDNKQFAVVENPGLWHWTFTLKDSNGDILAQIDRDFRGFGFELFTDAGKYVIRFGSSDSALKAGPGKEVEELEIARPLTLSERAVVLALAVSLDNDYFSRHGGWGIPFVTVTE